MHFCAFLQLSKFNIRCNVNLMFAKSLFSEICTQKAHFAQLWAVLGSIRRHERRQTIKGIKTIWFHMGPYGTEEETEGEADTEPEERRRMETEPQNAD